MLLTPGDAEAGEVFLVPAASAGPDPFSGTPFAPPPDPALAQPAVDGAPPTPAPAGAPPQQATSGSTPGLYGGTNDKSSCDPSAMVAFLGANPDKAQAWVDALVADPAVRLQNGQPLTVPYIPHYVAELTPITLMNDVRVTNHGFKNGRANQIQSVLQKGSAVMIDDRGVPRVKCYCGNPLLPPVATPVPPVYTGPKWPDFQPDDIVVVTPPPEPIEVLIVVVPNDPSQTIQIPPGSGDPDLQAYMVGGPPPTLPEPSATAPPAYVPSYADELASIPNECSPGTQAAPTSLQFVNSTSRPVDIYWHSYECELEAYGTLQPGESDILETYPGHFWTAVDAASGSHIGDFTAGGASSWSIQ